MTEWDDGWWWTEHVSIVRRARTAATLNIAFGKLRRGLVESWAVPLVEWLGSRLRGNGLGSNTRKGS